MTQLYLIRHTQAEGNRYRMMQGHWDGEITSLGLRQIDALSARFREIPIDAVYASDLTRAVKTAEGIANSKGLPVRTDVRLRELDLGPWESQFFGNILYRYPEQTEFFLHDPEKWAVPGAETMEAVAARGFAALEEIARMHGGESVAVVSHGVTIRCTLSRILNRRLSGEELLPIFQNTAVSKLSWENGAFTVDYMGDASHAESLLSSDWISLGPLRDEDFDPADDASFYRACYRDAWQYAHGGSLERYDSEPYFRSALEHYARHPGAVKKVFLDDVCVGLLDCDTERGRHAGYGWISLLYLVPEYRGKGYGIQLLARALALYRELGRRSVRLHTAASNEPALRFYQKCGFSILSAEPGAGGPLYLMEKQLGGGRNVR